jgi:hypothetical protein
VAHHRPVLATLLKEKASKGGLHQPVLIPLGVLLDESHHRLKEISRELVFHTHMHSHRIRNLGQPAPHRVHPPISACHTPGGQKVHHEHGRGCLTPGIAALQWIKEVIGSCFGVDQRCERRLSRGERFSGRRLRVAVDSLSLQLDPWGKPVGNFL